MTSQPPSDAFPAFDIKVLRGEKGSEPECQTEWERVFGHFQPRLESYFAWKGNDILVVDDLLQEIWLRAFLNVGSLGSSGAMWSWLVTIGKNLLRDELRRKRPVIEHLDTSDRESHILEFVGAVPAGADERILERAHELRNKISDDEWEFLNLLCVDNLTHEEVANMLGMTTAMASRQRLRRIRERLGA